MESLWAASMPLISSVGSASARPFFWAIRRASLNVFFSSVIFCRMKLVVPFKMPYMEVMLLGANPSLMAWMTGVPLQTAASK